MPFTKGNILWKLSSGKTRFKKGQKSWNKGRKETRLEVLERQSKSHLGLFLKEKSPLWKKFSKLTKIGLHQRMYRYYGRLLKCEHCGIKGKFVLRNGKKYWNIDWANKSRKYLSYELKDWLGLCRKCHAKYDKKKK